MSEITFSEPAEILQDIEVFSKLPTDKAAAAAQETVDTLDNVTLDIAVTGHTGAGKSMFVNAIRGVGVGESGAAETGITETTMEPSMYPHPRMPNVRLWDLPGIGSTTFKAETYLKKVKFDSYDFFIIVSSERFGENDLMLAKEIQKRKKLFYFVRSKIDNDVRAEERKPKFDLEALLVKIRENCQGNLEKLGDLQIFLVSSFELENYDFQKLIETLKTDLSEHKRSALVLSLPVFSLHVLEEKKRIFEKLVLAAGFSSAAIAVIPVPGLSVACDIAILLAFLLKCYFAFGLDEASLKKVSERTNKPIEDLKAVMKCPLSHGIDNKVILRMLTSTCIGAAMALEYLLSNIPVVGSFAAGGLSFATTYYLLKKGLNEMAEDARAVLEVAGLK